VEGGAKDIALSSKTSRHADYFERSFFTKLEIRASAVATSLADAALGVPAPPLALATGAVTNFRSQTKLIALIVPCLLRHLETLA
jgi:hypothetical protein